jgi:glutamate:GABA antiporter
MADKAADDRVRAEPEQPAGGLRRELGLRDLTLFAISCIVGTRWIAAAAHAGPGSITLWLLAALLFVVPLAIAVAALTVKNPGAGGLYLWARNDFGPWHGFLCFWVYWMAMAIWFPSAAIFYMSAALSAAGLPETRLLLLPAALAAIWIALGSNIVGMRIGKWTENIGGISAWILGGLLVAVSTAVYMRRGAATHFEIAPHWNWETVSFWASIAYALSGLEMAGLMGAEVRDPQRNFPRAGWIASGFSTVFYASTTAALLVLLPPSKISELNGLAESGREAAGVLGTGWLAPAVAVLVVASGMGQLGGVGTSISRLPFAAGTDRLLPPVFSRIHPRWGTPHIAILTLGVAASLLLAAMQVGDSLRAAYRALVSLMVIAGFLPYLYIFACSWRAGNRWSALSGWAVTLIAIACAVIPTADITNVWLFEGKLGIGTAAVIISAGLMYRHSKAKRWGL